jgi:hypothetical protein
MEIIRIRKMASVTQNRVISVTYNTVLHKTSLVEKKLGRDLLQVLDLEVLCCFQEITHLVKYEGGYSL